MGHIEIASARRETGHRPDTAPTDELSTYLINQERLNAPTAMVHDEHDDPMNTKEKPLGRYDLRTRVLACLYP
jgi:hypothetical protein